MVLLMRPATEFKGFHQRSIHFWPIGIALGWMLKKWTFYQFARAYGIPRIYRRLMEVNRRISTGSPQQYISIRSAVQFAFRVPSQAAKSLESNIGVLKLLSAFESEYFGKNRRKIPNAALSLGFSIFKTTSLYSAMKKYEDLLRQKEKRE